MPTQLLSPKTTYAAYLVFKVAKRNYGLEVPSETSVRFVVKSRRAEDSSYTVFLKLPTNGTKRLQGLLRHKQPSRLPHKRVDGWMEVELGEFFNDCGDDGEVAMELKEHQQLNSKTGLIVEGIELQPKE